MILRSSGLFLKSEEEGTRTHVTGDAADTVKMMKMSQFMAEEQQLEAALTLPADPACRMLPGRLPAVLIYWFLPGGVDRVTGILHRM